MSKTELRRLKFIHAVLANCIHEAACANLAQFFPPRTSDNTKINAELSEINMEINNLRENHPERPKAQGGFVSIVLGGGSF
jgi:hypothetical protein